MRGEAESLTEQEMTEDMVYGQLDGDCDAWSTLPSSAISTPVLRPIRPDVCTFNYRHGLNHH